MRVVSSKSQKLYSTPSAVHSTRVLPFGALRRVANEASAAMIMHTYWVKPYKTTGWLGSFSDSSQALAQSTWCANIVVVAVYWLVRLRFDTSTIVEAVFSCLFVYLFCV
jgi:hypothetical protein